MNLRPRQHPRFAVELRAAFTVDGQTRPATSRDLSRGGISLLARAPAPKGQTIDLQVSLALGSGTFTEDLHLPARVIWCTPVTGDAYQIGAVFEDLDIVTATQLEMYMRFLQHELLIEREAPVPDPLPFDTGGNEESDG